MTVTTPHPDLARTTDPATSHAAAAALDDSKLSAQKAAILEILAQHPRTDHDLARAYFQNARLRGWPITAVDSIRKRRAQLTAAGRVVPDTVLRGPYGRDVTVWKVAS